MGISICGSPWGFPQKSCGNGNGNSLPTASLLITLNNRWKQLSSINLNYFDVSLSPNYVDIIIIGRALPIGHSIHLNYHQKYHGSEEITRAAQSRHNRDTMVRITIFTIGCTVGFGYKKVLC